MPWSFAYLIPREFKELIRKDLVKQYQEAKAGMKAFAF